METPHARDSDVINQKLEEDLSLRISIHEKWFSQKPFS